MMLPGGIAELIDAYLDGDLGPAAVEQFKAWLEEDDANVALFAHQVFLHQQLRETMLAENAAECLEAIADAESPAAPKPIVFDEVESKNSLGLWGHFPVVLFIVLLAAVVSGAIAFQLGRTAQLGQTAGVNRPDEAPSPILAVQQDQDQDSVNPPRATLVAVTNCRWDPTRSTADLNRGSQLQPGQSLHLLEGVAEINSILPGGMVGRFQLEGPVGLMMTSHGLPSLLYGKLSAMITCDYEQFALDTPLGRVVVWAGEWEGASIGIAAHANDVELHVFSGVAAFEPLRIFVEPGDLDQRLRVSAGSALRLSTTPERTVAIERYQADEWAFITDASLAASNLAITDTYVSAVKEAGPIAYWRFNRFHGGAVRNEMGDRFHCRVLGPVRQRVYPSNQTAEFGFAHHAGLLLSDEDLGNLLSDGYTAEMWMKPSHYHLAAVFSLVESGPENQSVPHHGVLVQLSPPGTERLRGTIRLLHRSPPGFDPREGTSIHSRRPYASRQWQHVVAVKDRESLRLYLDGELTAKTKDSTTTPEGLRILMGQLYPLSAGPHDSVRPFVGELDEVAIYDRPLTEQEIIKHFNLVRTEAATGQAVNAPSS